MGRSLSPAQAGSGISVPDSGEIVKVLFVLVSSIKDRIATVNHGSALMSIPANDNVAAVAGAIEESAGNPKQRAIVPGEPATPRHVPSGTRCITATERCSTEAPPLQEINGPLPRSAKLVASL